MDEEFEYVCACAGTRRAFVSSSLDTMGFEIMLFRLGDVAVERERRDGLKKRLRRVLSLAIVFGVNGNFLGEKSTRDRRYTKCASRRELQDWAVFQEA